MTEWAPATAIAEFLEAHTRLTRPRDVMIFFAGAALATLPSLAFSPPAWVFVLLVGEAVLAGIAWITWTSRGPRLQRAREAVDANKIVRIEDYSLAPPTTRKGPPEEKELVVRLGDGPRVEAEPPPSVRKGPPAPPVSPSE